MTFYRGKRKGRASNDDASLLKALLCGYEASGARETLSQGMSCRDIADAFHALPQQLEVGVGDWVWGWG